MIRMIIALLLSGSLFISAHVVARELPAGGGEPAAALLQHFAAIRSGDANRIISGLHPDQPTQTSAVVDGKFQDERFLHFLQAVLPPQISISGGHIHGDHATVLFTGNIGNYVSKNSAQMVRINGRWLVKGINFNCAAKGC